VRWLALSAGAALVCAVSLLAGTRPAQAGINLWTSHGPAGGNVQALTLDPAPPQTLYAGTSRGGVAKSTDGGSTRGATRLASGDGAITIDEILTAVNAALNGCGG
jgi:hypothetical protein